jgi:hypothetical protein
MDMKLEKYLVNVGTHPVFEYPWWQIAFDFGDVQVSIAETPYTEGVELMVWGMSEKPLTNVTPGIVVNILDLLLQRLEAKQEVNYV